MCGALLSARRQNKLPESRTGIRDKSYNRCIDDAGDTGDTAAGALARAAVISGAQGVLMERYGCDSVEAYDILLDLAGRDDARVYVIAALILQHLGP